MRQLVVVDKEKCNTSLACIRICPVKAIKIEDNHATIVASRCIGCGECVTVCAQNAISYRDEKDLVMDLLKEDLQVAAICDPSISGEFVDISDYRKFVAMIRALGFKYVLEMAFGIDLLAYRYRDLLEDFHGRYYIHTVCPTVGAYVGKFQPELIDNLVQLVPPYTVMAKIIRKIYGEKVKIVYITACVAAKDDARMHKNDGKIDQVLTFVELRELFARKKISENSVEFSDFDPPLGRKGGLYPIRRGMLQAVDINQELLSGDIISANGQYDFKESISEFKSQSGLNQHLDLFYCQGCVMGPGMSPGGKKFMRRSEVIKYVNKRLKGLDLVNWHEQIEKYKDLDLSRTFKAQDRRLPQPPDSEIRRVLHEMGKSKAEDQLGCGACGYPSCREFAIAYCQGLTNFEMCYSYSINKLHTFINKVNATNEKLKKTKEALKESEEKARTGEIAALEAAEVTTIMLDKINAGVVIVDEKLKIIESNKAFINMLGDDARSIDDLIPGLKGAELASLIPFYRLFASVLQSGQDMLNRDTPFEDSIFNVSVFTIKKHKVVGGIMRDLTSPNVRKEEVINRAKTVIRENLETVQQIAFLLGESASKTEKILSSIIDAQKLGSDENSLTRSKNDKKA